MHTTIHTIKWTLTSACNRLAIRKFISWYDLISWNVHATLAHLQRPGSVAPCWNSCDYPCDRWRPSSTTMNWAMRAPLGRRAVQEGRWSPCRRLLARARHHRAQGCRNPGQARGDLQIVIAATRDDFAHAVLSFLPGLVVGREKNRPMAWSLVHELEPQSDQLSAELGWPRKTATASLRRLAFQVDSFIHHVIAHAALANYREHPYNINTVYRKSPLPLRMRYIYIRRWLNYVIVTQFFLNL